MAAVVTKIVVGAGERGDGLEAAGGRWDEPTQANARGDRLDCGETAGLDEAGSGSVVMPCRAHVGMFTRGPKKVVVQGQWIPRAGSLGTYWRRRFRFQTKRRRGGACRPGSDR